MIQGENELPGINLSEATKIVCFPFAGKTIVVTGKLRYFTRAAIHARIRELGAKVGKTVSKNTDYLICGEKPGSKLTRAMALGVRILTEQEFLKMIQYTGGINL